MVAFEIAVGVSVWSRAVVSTSCAGLRRAHNGGRAPDDLSPWQMPWSMGADRRRDPQGVGITGRIECRH